MFENFIAHKTDKVESNGRWHLEVLIDGFQMTSSINERPPPPPCRVEMDALLADFK